MHGACSRALVLACVLLSACDWRERKFAHVDVTGATYAREFALTDHTGQPRTLADFHGKVVFIFFGYTQCPDACPTALSEMRVVMDAIGPQDASRVQVLFVTVDPRRDTPELLSHYVPAFHPSFLGLHGDATTIARTAKSFNVFYERREGKTPTTYTIDHTAGSYVYDTFGRLRLFVRHGMGPDSITADVKTLLAER